MGTKNSKTFVLKKVSVCVLACVLERKWQLGHILKGCPCEYSQLPASLQILRYCGMPISKTPLDF